MKISYNWLKELIDFDCSPQELGNMLTMSGSEVEAMEKKGVGAEGIVAGHVLKVDPHPDADKLTVCTVDVGDEKLIAVCGAPNVAVGQDVVFAKIGATLTGGLKLKKAKIRGVESFGMILAEDELGISDDHTGIIVLDDSPRPGTDIQGIIKLNDYIYEFEITPNRPDCLSHIGMAREVKALLGGKIKCPDFTAHETGPDVSKELTIKIDDPDGCPRYTGRLVSGVKIGPSPLWLKSRLFNLGVRPINNVVDISNFVMLETGHPLHAFDFSYFKTKTVGVRRARQGEKFTTLDDTERQLNSGHLLITDGDKAVALAGIMGGLNSEVTDSTTDILLESAYFNPVSIRRGAKAVGLSTESSQRFERGADPEMAPKANNRACNLIAEFAGGKIYKGMVDAHPKPFEPVSINFRSERANYVLGSNINETKIFQIFDDLDIKYEKKKTVNVIQPSFRPDLTREIDLVEEIARVYGLDNIENRFRPGGTLATPVKPSRAMKDRLRSFLVGRGFYETFSLTLIDARQLKKIDDNLELVSLMNPLSEEMSALRPNLVFSVIRTLRQNINHGSKDLKIFEIGTAYKPSAGELADENEHICLGLSGLEQPVSWRHPNTESDFYSLKAELEAIFDYLMIDNMQLIPLQDNFYAADYGFAINCGKLTLGKMGKISGQAAKNLGLKQSAFAAELEMQKLAELSLRPHYMKPLPKFPSSDRDIALLINQEIQASEIAETIYSAGKKLIENVFPFDLYKGKNIEEGKKSIAFRIIYRSADKTLTDEEVEAAHKKVVNQVCKKFGAELRA